MGSPRLPADVSARTQVGHFWLGCSVGKWLGVEGPPGAASVHASDGEVPVRALLREATATRASLMSQRWVLLSLRVSAVVVFLADRVPSVTASVLSEVFAIVW